MKRYIHMVGIFLMVFSLGMSAQNPSKEIHEQYNANEISKLVVEAKYGQTNITDDGSNVVKVDVKITANTDNERKAQMLLDAITVKVNKSGSLLYVETEISSNKPRNSSFDITYDINIPKNKDIAASSKYGDLFVESLTGNGAFEIAYGNFRAGNLLTPEPVSIEVAYGSASINQFKKASIELRYGSVKTSKSAEEAHIDSRYSQVQLDDINQLTLDSKGDDVKVGAVQQLTIDMAYSSLSVDKLIQSLLADCAYGNIKVYQVQLGFEKIFIDDKYGDVLLRMDSNAAYKLSVEGKYADIKVPEMQKATTVIDGAYHEFKGVVGSGKISSSVDISSSYGSIRVD